MHDPTTARAILAALGLDHATLSPIGEGLASDAWLVEGGTPARRSVLRVTNDPEGLPPTYPMEHALLARLAAAGAAVPTPIVGDWNVDGWPGPAFSMTTWRPGRPLRVQDRDRAVEPIAAFVRTLRSLEIPGLGALVVVDHELRGHGDDPETALIEWAQRPFWPLGGARLIDHEALGERPALAARLEDRATRVRTALLSGPVAVLHSDLHEENLLDDDGSITVIDVGEALTGPAAWEFAAIAYFTDWSFADAVLVAFLGPSTPDHGTLARWRADASAIGLAFGVYRWALDRDLAADEDAHDQAFLEATLGRMG